MRGGMRGNTTFSRSSLNGFGSRMEGEDSRQPWLRASPDFVFAGVDHAMSNTKTAVIRTWLVRTGFAFQPFGGGMQWREPLGQLRAKERESGNATKSG